MQKILATKTASLTDLRDPMKVIESAAGAPVAIMNRNKVLGYFVPEGSVHALVTHSVSDEEFARVSDVVLKKGEPVLEYLKDK